jgi:lambda family phage portal protein
MGLLDFLSFRNEQADEQVGKRSRRRLRHYAGANQGRLFADFIGSSFSADSELRTNLPILRNRSRDLARNNEYAKRFLNLIKTNVVGEKGFTLQVRARNSDRSLDSAGNAIIEDAFKAWGRLGNCDATGRMSWLDAQRYAAETLARDGEVFVKFVQNRRFRDGFALQFIESDLVDESKNGKAENGNQIRMGVEIDQFQRPVAYYVLTAHPNDTLNFANKVNRKHIRVPASEMLHVFIPQRTHQNRGEPFMAPAIASLKMLHGYREAELIAARAAAAKFGIITTPDGDEFIGDDQTEDEVPVIDMAPASVYQLPSGHDFKMIDPAHPTSAFADFEEAVLRGIASGLNVSYTSLSNDLKGVSYSSIRQGTIEERDHYKTLQSFIIQHFCEPVFRAWLDSALTFGDIPIPISKYGKFADNVHFRGRGFAWVDPQREINANVTALSNGIVSMNDIASNYGRDVEDLFEQIQSDKEMAERYGLKMAFEPFGQKAPVQPEITEDADDV